MPEPQADQGERALTATERRWLTRLQRTLDAKPDTLIIYCHGDTATVLDRDAYDGADEYSLRDAIIEEASGINTPGWIAGDF